MAKGDALKMLQTKCGVTPDGAFGPNTARAIADHYKFERQPWGALVRSGSARKR